jgi:hypothetical protein
MSVGRKKGYSPLIEISYDELGDWVGKKAKVVVSKNWLLGLGYLEEEDQEVESNHPKVVNTKENSIEDKPKIEYTLTHL